MSVIGVSQDAVDLLKAQETQAPITRESIHLLQALSQRNIRFAHWKSNIRLTDSMAGKTDIDILVHPHDKQAFEQLMQQLSYKKLKSQPWSSYPQVDDWMGLDEETGSFLHLHTHYAMVTGIKHVKHLYLPWLEEFFQQLQVDEQTGWPIPKPEMEALILLVRVWAKTPPLARLNKAPQIPDYLQAELVGLLQSADLKDLVHLSEKLGLQLPEDFQDRIRRIIKYNDAHQIRLLSQHLYAQLSHAYRQSWPSALLKSFYYQLVLKGLSRSAKYIGPLKQGKTLVGGGKVIALVGCDGSGKSTLSADILKWLTYKIDTHYFYMGKHPFIRSYHKTMVAASNLIFSNSRVAKLLRKVLGDVYFLLLIQKKRNLLQKAKAMTQQGSVIICDRFPQQDIFGLNDGPNLQQHPASWAARQEISLFRQVKAIGADLMFRLRVSPEVAARRKPEHSFEKIKAKSESINNIQYGTNILIEIDADKPYSQVLLEVKKQIWKHL